MQTRREGIILVLSVAIDSLAVSEMKRVTQAERSVSCADAGCAHLQDRTVTWLNVPGAVESFVPAVHSVLFLITGGN